MQKRKKSKNTQSRLMPKKSFVFLYVIGISIVFCLLLGLFLFFNGNVQKSASIYVYPENTKQGDTVFVRVKSTASNVSGNFNDEKLFFYKKYNSEEWISFLGIDADQKPGKYKISVDTLNKEHLEKGIDVSLADFSSALAAAAPSAQKTGITNQKAVENIRKSDNPAINKVFSNFTAQSYFDSPFSFPLSSMKKSGFSFGKFIDFAKYKIQHLGVDLKAPEKTEIYSVNDGKVAATLDLPNYGKTVIIDHGLDIFSLYLHLDKFKVSEGQSVKRGQIIGLSGNTGYVTAPHLHFSMRVGGSRVDPIEFIQATQKMNGESFMANISNAFLNILK